MVIQFNIFLNDWFLFIIKASLHKYADDYYLLAFSIENDLLVKFFLKNRKLQLIGFTQMI